MRRIISIILFTLSTNVSACKSYIFGFRGIHGQFDNKPFIEYAYEFEMCWVIFNADETRKAIKLIRKINVPYELYGYSLGAQSVKTVLERVSVLKLKKPIHVMTIGAYYSTDVNFTKYDVSFINYFDASGKGQKSPGIFVNAIPHNKMQEHVDGRIR